MTLSSHVPTYHIGIILGVRRLFGLKGSGCAAHLVDWPVNSLWAQHGLSWTRGVAHQYRCEESRERTEQWGIALLIKALPPGVKEMATNGHSVHLVEDLSTTRYGERATLLKATDGKTCLRGGRWSFPAHWSARHRTRQNGDGPCAGYGRGGTAGGAWKSKGKKQVAGDWHCNFHNNSKLRPWALRRKVKSWRMEQQYMRMSGAFRRPASYVAGADSTTSDNELIGEVTNLLKSLWVNDGYQVVGQTPHLSDQVGKGAQPWQVCT